MHAIDSFISYANQRIGNKNTNHLTQMNRPKTCPAMRNSSNTDIRKEINLERNLKNLSLGQAFLHFSLKLLQRAEVFHDGILINVASSCT